MDKVKNKEEIKQSLIRRESKIMGFSNKIFKAQVSSS